MDGVTVSRNGSPSRAVIGAVVACKVLSLILRQCFVTGPTLGFAATVCRLGSHVVTGLQITDSSGRLMQMSSVADKHPLAYSVPAMQRSVTQSTPRAVTLSGCLLLSLRSISIHSQHQCTNRLQVQVDVPCCSSRQIRRAWAVNYCTIAHAHCCSLFPIFPGI